MTPPLRHALTLTLVDALFGDGVADGQDLVAGLGEAMGVGGGSYFRLGNPALFFRIGY